MKPESFILRSSLTSPFVRKVRMAADVLGLTDRITLLPTDAFNPADELRNQNPLGKYPCLLREDGTAVFDSGVILEFLQEVAGTDRLLPSHGPRRVPMMTMCRLADGIIDAGACIIYEQRYHDADKQSPEWLDYQKGKIRRGLAAFEARKPDPSTTDAVSIGLACTLGFLDRRPLVDWRHEFVELAGWLQKFENHEPAFERTRPPAA